MSKKLIPLFRCPYCHHGDVAIDTAAVADYRAAHSRSDQFLFQKRRRHEQRMLIFPNDHEAPFPCVHNVFQWGYICQRPWNVCIDAQSPLLPPTDPGAFFNDFFFDFVGEPLQGDAPKAPHQVLDSVRRTWRVNGVQFAVEVQVVFAQNAEEFLADIENLASKPVRSARH